MALTPGTRIGAFEVVGVLGAGGMGEVYRARDTGLKRDVALKILPASFASDPDRLARFQREAEVLASLNHPNIAAIHGLEESNGTRALVMELVEGPTLADRIAQGPVPIDEALPIAKQIAEALEAAHEQGIIHRDLKPANIKLRPDGVVKVLDFGLAKALEPISGVGVDATASPTITSPAMTRMGVILGTAAYMSPEQARGKAVDKRSDIWAFGCVLYEMLTGRRVFEGEDIAETVGAVIHKEPLWNVLPPRTPTHLRTLLQRCLQKDLKKRLPHIGVARMEIDDTPADGAPPFYVATDLPQQRASSQVRVAWSATAVAVAGAIVLAIMTYRDGNTDDVLVTRTSILPPAGVGWANVPPNTGVALSPDGRRLAFLGTDASGTRLWVRPIDAVAAQPLAGTEGVVLAAWSPDSQFLAFVAGGTLRKMDASGGPAITLVGKPTNFGLAWGPQDDILFAPDGRGPLFRVSASGGQPSPVTMLDPASGETGHGGPFFLPDGRHFLYAARTTSSIDDVSLYVGSLDAADERRLLLQDAYNAQYASGYLLFTRDATLMAQPFDTARLELTGEAVPLAEQLRLGGVTRRGAAVSTSQVGTLVYQTGLAAGPSQLTWYDRAGKPLGTLGEPADHLSIELSPDGTRVLAGLADASRRSSDLWIYDVRRGLRTRFTFDPSSENMGVWSPDGSRVAFNSERAGRLDVYMKAASGVGAEQLLAADDQNKWPYSWSPDGRLIAYHNGTGSGSGSGLNRNLWMLPSTGDAKPSAFLETSFDEFRPRFSPDGRWLAYASDESGRREIYVMSFPDRAGKWQVSTAGGDWPRWRRDGRELFYLTLDTNPSLMAVPVNAAATALEVGEVQSLFQIDGPTTSTGYLGYPFDVSADAQRFLVHTTREGYAVEPLTLLTNWPALLRR